MDSRNHRQSDHASPSVNISPPAQTSLLDLPRSVLSKIVTQLHRPTDVINRCTLREVEDIFNLAETCKGFQFVFSMYSKTTVNLNPWPSYLSTQNQCYGPLRHNQYPVLFQIPFFCSTNLMKVHLPRDFSAAYLEFFLWSLSQACPNIYALSFCHSSNPNSDHLTCLSEFPNLIVLEIEEPTTAVLGYLEQGLPQLQQLSFLKFPLTLLTCLHHSLNTRALRVKAESKPTHIAWLNIFLQREDVMKSTDFTSFFFALKQPDIEYLEHLKHLHLRIPGWTGSLEALKARMTSNGCLAFSQLKLKISKWSVLYDRRETSATAHGRGVVMVQRHFLGPKGYDLAPENVENTIEKLDNAEAIVLSEEIFRKFSKQNKAHLDDFYRRLRDVTSIEELIWDSRGFSNKNSTNLFVETASKILESMSCIRRLKLYINEVHWNLLNLFSKCENISKLWLSFMGIQNTELDAVIRFVTDVTKLVPLYLSNIEEMVIEMEENPPKEVTQQSCRDLSNQINKLELDFPDADFESLRFWHEYFTTTQN